MASKSRKIGTLKQTSLWLKIHKITVFSLFILLAGVIAVAWFVNREEVIETQSVMRHDLVQEVSISGAVKPVTETSLAFEVGGTISSLPVRVGQEVTVGQIVAQLNSSSLSAQRSQAEATAQAVRAQLSQAQAAAKRERVVLQDLQIGKSPEEIAVIVSRLNGSRNTQGNTLVQFASSLQSVYLIADDMIRNDADTLFDDPHTNPRLLFSTEYDIAQEVEDGREDIERLLEEWQGSLTYTVDIDDTLELETQARTRLSRVLEFLDDLSYALNLSESSVRASQSTLDAWGTLISGSRSTIVTALSTISTAYAAVTNATAALELIERELAVALIGASSQDIDAQELRVQEADIAVQNYEAQVAKSQADIRYIDVNVSHTVLRAPGSGIITKKYSEVGEVVSARETIFELVSTSQSDIEVYVPEADIAKVSVGKQAEIEFDAYPDLDPRKAEVVFIDPASTDTDGLSTYKVLLQLDDADTTLIKPGMTIDATIITDERTQVVAVPLRSTRVEGGQAFIQILTADNLVEKRPITLGLRSNSGLVEVVSGVEEGEQYIPVF